jgi:ribose/xylose/arabinose/galactoside ABC-type transport system permease subunit
MREAGLEVTGGRVGEAGLRAAGGALLRRWQHLLVFLLLVALSAYLSEYFLTVENVMNVLRQVSVVGILAVGATFVIISGGVDLSVGGVAALGSVAVALAAGAPTPLVLILPVAIGTVVGLANGLITLRLGLQPFIVTLATGSIADGLAFYLSDGNPIRFEEPVVGLIGRGYLGPVPVSAVVLMVVMLVGGVVLSRTVYGYTVYALGGNEDACRLSGMPIVRYRTITYTVAGALSGLGGLVLAGRISIGDPTAGAGFGLALDAVTPVLIGGTDLMGGSGTMTGTFIGVLIVGMLNNVFNLLSVTAYWQMVAKGAIILAAVYLGYRQAR